MIKDTFDAFTNRIKNPISGSFTIIWAICNWKTVVYLFSSYPPESKIYNVLEQLTWTHSLFLPLSFTILYLISIPILGFFYKLFSDKIELWNYQLDLDHKSRAANLEQYNNASNTEILLAMSVFAGELRGNFDSYIKNLEDNLRNNPYYFQTYPKEIIADLNRILTQSTDSFNLSEKIKEIIVNRRYAGPGSSLISIHEKLKSLNKL